MLAYTHLSAAVQYLGLAAPLFAILFILFWSIHSHFRLRDVPGPFIAAWTNLPRLSWVLSNRAHEIHIRLHRQYGKMVRFGPNMVSISDPAEISAIYGFNPIFQKVWDLLTLLDVNGFFLTSLLPLVGFLPRTAVLRQRETGPHDIRNTK